MPDTSLTSPTCTAHRGEVVDHINGFDVIACVHCGFTHILPIPGAEELEQIYRHAYYSTEKPLYIQRYQEDLEWWNLVYGERYDTFESLLSPDRRTILDVGSGPGYFLLHGRDRGWQTTGVEPSRQAAAHSRGLGLDIREMMLDEHSAAELGRYDVIHLSEVLEHLPDPRAMVRLAHRLLNDDGLLCIAVPNDYNPFQLALREGGGFEPWWVAPPHHINYFSFETLQALLRSEHFVIERTEATFPIDLFLLMGDNYVGHDILGRQCHQKRMQFEKNLRAAGQTQLKRGLYAALAKLGLGREAVVYARRDRAL
jgi:SAM-dependent methyltransferase